MKLFVLFLFLIVLPYGCKAQFGNIWCFGYHFGIDFNGGRPLFFDSTSIRNLKGASSVCDQNGHLLFYTDGSTVWNRFHKQMPNGDSLAWARHIASEEYPGVSEEVFISGRVLILPVDSTSKYYVFTTDNYYSSSQALQYHLVDMSADSGRGDVVFKNRVLQEEVRESLTAARHCNGRDWWVVCRKIYTDEYLSYLVSPDTVWEVPVFSRTGTFHHPSASDFVGNSKISPNGRWLATTYDFGGNVELAHFDNQTGEVRVLLQDDGLKFSLGCTFSFDSKFLFVSTVELDSTTIDSVTGNFLRADYIKRYDLTNPDSTAIIYSAYRMVDLSPITPVQEWQYLQLAPDEHVYAFKLVTDSSVTPSFARSELWSISPFSDTLAEPILSLRLSGYLPVVALPTFPDAIFTNHHKASLRIPGCVPGKYDSIPFFDSLLTTTRDYIWDFGDTASGVHNTSDQRNPVHAFSAPGTYTVTLSLPSECHPIAVSREVIVAPPEAEVPTIELSGVYLQSTVAEQYQWFLDDVSIAGAEAQTYYPLENGLYRVRITDRRGCTQISPAFLFNSAGIHATSPTLEISVYPNPAGDFLYFNSLEPIENISVLDVAGKEVLRTLKSEQSLGIQNLSPGFYLIRVSIKGQVLSGRFVKE